MSTPADLHALIGRALVDGASRDDRRAARHACLTLAAALGDPGDPMSVPGVPARPARIDSGQVLDFLGAQMRAYLDEHADKAIEVDANSSPEHGPTTPAGARDTDGAPPAARAAPAASSPSPWSRHRPIPLVPLPRLSRKP